MDMDTINQLYTSYTHADFAYKQDPSEANSRLLYVVTNDLFKDVLDYALRTVCQIGISRGWVSIPAQKEDLASEAAMKVWRSLPAFRGECEFSTWVYRAAGSVTSTYARHVTRSREVPFFEWKAYDSEYCGSKGGAEGSGPLTETDDSPAGLYLAGSPITDSISNAADDGAHKQPLMSESDRRREENLRIGRLDLRDALDSLSADDRALFIFKDEMGYSAAAIAAFFGQNDRWVENKIVSIRKRLKEFSIGPISGV